MTYVEVFGGSYFLAWCSLWLFWGVVPITTVLINFVMRCYSRTLRSLNILFRGWPPKHLDADGDFFEAEQPAEES